MKLFINITTIILLFFTNNLIAQRPCKVQVKNLQGTYEGECKNGRANGQGSAKGIDSYTGDFKKGYPNGNGIYNWANGDVYEGEWKMGARNGKGKFNYKKNDENKIDEGIWDTNIFLGKELLSPTITEKTNIKSGFYFKRLSNGSKLTISFTQNGLPATPIDLYVVRSSGTESPIDNNLSIINMTFPFKCKVKFRSDNGIVKSDCILSFEILQQGEWILNIDQKSNVLNRPDATFKKGSILRNG